VTEKNLRELLKRRLPPKTHFCPMENTSGPGTPDVNLCLNGVEVWLELKIIVGKRKLRFQKALSASQRNWLVSRSRAGGNAFLLARHDKQILLWIGSKLAQCSLDAVLEALPPDYCLFLNELDDLEQILIG